MTDVIEQELAEITALVRMLSDRAHIAVRRLELTDEREELATRSDMELARLARRYLRARRRREVLFCRELFADPAWDMLIDLFAAEVEGQRVSVTSVCAASAVPPTTALRWLSRLEEEQLVFRMSDPNDQRRTFVYLNPSAFSKIRNWLDASL
ncbi:hypothetical protein ACX40Y_00360 [Sphingomonas sp. RS6]